MNESEPAPASRVPSGCRKAAGIGCGCLVVVLTIVGALLALNWPKVTELWSRGAATMTELLAVRAAVADRHGLHANVKAKHHSGVAGPILSIELINAPGFEGLSEAQMKLKAREIAVTARDAMSTPNSYRRFEVVVARRVGAGVHVTTKTAFRFTAEELPPPAAEH